MCHFVHHVDLHLTHGRSLYAYYGRPTQPARARELLWRFIQNFNTTTKLLKLRIDYFTMDNLALVDEASRDELLGGLSSFSLVEQLELEAEYKPGETSMVMLADLLHYSCPMVGDLRIKLTNQYETPWSEDGEKSFDKSVSGFRNRRRTSLAGQNDENDYEDFGIPGLNGERSFSCLQSHLKRVSLQFFKDEPNCLGIQVAKFFAKNAMVLQEMQIDDGCQEMLEHMNLCPKMDC